MVSSTIKVVTMTFIRMRKDYDNKCLRSLWGVSTEVELQKILDVWKSEMWQSTP